jgi:hypothetical protein
MAAVVDCADCPTDLVAVAPQEADDSMMLSVEELAAHSRSSPAGALAKIVHYGLSRGYTLHS